MMNELPMKLPAASEPISAETVEKPFAYLYGKILMSDNLWGTHYVGTRGSACSEVFGEGLDLGQTGHNAEC